jgi:hypothetical protein
MIPVGSRPASFSDIAVLIFSASLRPISTRAARSGRRVASTQAEIEVPEEAAVLGRPMALRADSLIARLSSAFTTRIPLKAADGRAAQTLVRGVILSPRFRGAA